MGLAAMTLAVLNVQQGWGIAETIVVVLLIGAVVRAINAVFGPWFGIHSLIVTLGTGYFINGLVLWIFNPATVAGVSPGQAKVVILTRFPGIPPAFWFAASLAIIIWYSVQYTALGRGR